MEGQKQRHPSGGVSVSAEMVLGLEGVELGADGKVRKYFVCCRAHHANEWSCGWNRELRIGGSQSVVPCSVTI